MCLFLKRGLVHSISHENEFYLHVNENSFPYERLSTNICFEKEAQDNLEIAYSYKYMWLVYVPTIFSFYPRRYLENYCIKREQRRTTKLMLTPQKYNKDLSLLYPLLPKLRA